MIEVSVVVPIYNAGKKLEKCIKSILNQTFTNFELILVNDGSTDNSINICKKYELKDNRVRVIDKKNDLYNFYMRYALNFDFDDLFNYYESKYPLLKEEKLLLYILISIPNDIHFTNNEIENCKNCKNMIDRIYKTEVLIFKNTKEGNTE